MTKHEQKHTRKAAFAVICDPEYSSEEYRYPICELTPIDDMDVSNRPISRCGKYYYWQSGKFIVSDTMIVELPYDPITTEDEVNWVQEKINMERSKSQKELERKLDPLKARLTELLAITYQPTQAE